MRLSLRLQIFLSVVVVGVLPVFALGFNDIQAIQASLGQEVQRETRLAAQSASAQLALLVRDKMRLMELLVAQTDRARSAADIEKLLVETNSTVPGMTGLVLLDENGIAQAASSKLTTDGKSFIGLDYSDRPYFKALSSGARRAVPGFVMSKSTGLPGMAVAAARVSDDGEFRGLIAAAVKLTAIVEAVRGVSDAVEALSIDVIDAEGRLIASTRQEANGQVLPLALFAAPEEDVEIRTGLGPDGEQVE
ncbi:MAG: cache domain-containing protein, partial [Myxococcota bacterium]